MLVVKRFNFLPERPLGLDDGYIKSLNPKLRFELANKTCNRLLFTWGPRRKWTDLQLHIRRNI